MLGEIVRAWRAAGPRGVWFGALARAKVYRRLELVELALRPPPPLLETDIALEFGFIEQADDDGARARLERGDRCFVAWHEGRRVSSRWIAEGRAHISYLDRWLELASDEVYLSETYTDPEARGHGISGAAGTRLAAELAAEGRRAIVAGVLRENHGGTRAYEKAGYRRVGRVGYVGLGPWRRHFGRA